MHLGIKFRDVVASPRLKALNCEDKSLLTWFYCGIKKNTRDQFQPLANVAFRYQFDDGSFSDNVVYRDIPVEHLGQLSIGSLCKNNRVTAWAQFEEREFEVLHYRKWYWFESFHGTEGTIFDPPYPMSLYPLPYPKDRNWMVSFKLKTGGKLVIPTLEYFTRCYGRSGKLRRYLTTPRLCQHGNFTDLFFNPINQPEEPGKWKINLRKGFYDGDAIFLAHLKYDEHTQMAAKSASSMSEAQYQPIKGHTLTFPKIGPWYLGPSRLLVRGYPFNENRSFLGLQITGVSEPLGKEIEKCRDNRNNAINPASLNAEGNAWRGASLRRSLAYPEILDVTAYDAPDHGSPTYELENPRIKILGKRRPVTTFRDHQAKDRAGMPKLVEGNETLSSGDPHGSDKSVDQASIHTPELTMPEMESEGTLRDIWNAAKLLKETQSDVTRVEWYTINKGFNEDDQPQLLALRPYDIDETIDGVPIPTSTRNWVYLDPATKEQIRGLLIMRLTINERYIYVVEIQRRVIIKDTKGEIAKEDDSLCGIVFTLDSQEDLSEWIEWIRSHVRRVKGIVKNIVGKCPGEADVFRHRPSSKDRVPHWAALLNALKKAGIIFSS